MIRISNAILIYFPIQQIAHYAVMRCAAHRAHAGDRGWQQLGMSEARLTRFLVVNPRHGLTVYQVYKPITLHNP